MDTAYESFDQIDQLDPEYLLPGSAFLIPRGDLTLLYGTGGVGKGRLLMSVIADVVNDGGSVIVILPEDHPHEQVRPRLEAAGVGDLGKVINMTRLPNGGARFKLSANFARDPGHLPLLRQAIDDLNGAGHDVRLVIIDPIAGCLGSGTLSTNRGARAIIEPLQDLCADSGVSCMMVAHSTKDGKLQGSGGLRDAVRLLYKVAPDPLNPLVRVVTAEKSNNLPGSEPLKFVIEDRGGGPQVIWLTSSEIDRRQRSWREPGASQRVLEILASAPGPLTAQEISSRASLGYGHCRVILHRMAKSGQVWAAGRNAYVGVRDGATQPLTLASRTL